MMPNNVGLRTTRRQSGRINDPGIWFPSSKASGYQAFSNASVSDSLPILWIAPPRSVCLVRLWMQGPGGAGQAYRNGFWGMYRIGGSGGGFMLSDWMLIPAGAEITGSIGRRAAGSNAASNQPGNVTVLVPVYGGSVVTLQANGGVTPPLDHSIAVVQGGTATGGVINRRGGPGVPATGFERAAGGGGAPGLLADGGAGGADGIEAPAATADAGRGGNSAPAGFGGGGSGLSVRGYGGNAPVWWMQFGFSTTTTDSADGALGAGGGSSNQMYNDLVPASGNGGIGVAVIEHIVAS